MAAEYIASAGNPNIILCERGIRTFETYARNTLDLTAVPVLHHLTHLPVVVDPSHATGKRWLVKPLAIGGVAVGADGIMVEVHPRPDEALSDGEQSLTFAHVRPDDGRAHRASTSTSRTSTATSFARRRRDGRPGRVSDAAMRPARAVADVLGRRRWSCAPPRACAARPRCPATSRSRTAPCCSRCSPRARAGSRRPATARTYGRRPGWSPPSGRPSSGSPSATAGSTTGSSSPGGDALAEPEDILDCGNSGTTARLAAGRARRALAVRRARRRRLAPPAADGPDRGAAAPDGREARGPGRRDAPAARDHRPRPT